MTAYTLRDGSLSVCRTLHSSFDKIAYVVVIKQHLQQPSSCNRLAIELHSRRPDLSLQRATGGLVQTPIILTLV